MTGNEHSLKGVLSDIVIWSKTPEGKSYINNACDEAQAAGLKLRKEATLKPEKLSMIIGI